MEIKAIVGAKFGTLSSRKTTSTNPFEKTSFKGKAFGGNVLPFADVFQAIKPIESPKPHKLKMISGAVIGAVVDFKTKLTQPIALFASKVRENIAHGIDRVKDAKNSIISMSRDVHGRIAQVFDWHKLENKPNIGPKVLSMRHINEKASVQDLRATWVAANAIKLSNEGRKAVA